MSDNNNSYPSPRALSDNATLNAAAEAEYLANKTGENVPGVPYLE